MKLTREEARDIIWQDNEDWETVEEERVGHSRWSIQIESIVKHLPSDKFYRVYWSKGATEQQYEKPFENEDPVFTEVHQVEKTVVVKSWETV